MNKALFWLLAVTLAWGVSSCNFYRRITGRKKAKVEDSTAVAIIADTLKPKIDSAVVKIDSTTKVPVTPVDTAELVLLQALLPHWNTKTSWTTFSGKAKMHYEGKGSSYDFTSVIRMENGKSLWLSASILGGMVEAARILITPDTIRIMNRLNKEVTILPFSAADSLLPVHADFNSLQALIIGDVLQRQDQPNAAKDTAGALI